MASKTHDQISYNMRQVKSKDSKIEVALRRELWARGLRYRKNVTRILGKPDIAFIGRKIAIFCDSEFWHGYDWENKKKEIKSNQEFWIAKIEKNIERDKYVTQELQRDGWLVLRFWGNDIMKNLADCANKIETAVKERPTHGKKI